MTRPTTPRVTPVPENERTDSVQQLLEASMLPDANIFATFVRAPGLFRKWLPFGGKLLNGKIPARERELMILRTAWNCQSPYEWGQHVIMGKRSGLSPEEIRKVASDSLDGWDAHDQVLINAADELHREFCITDQTWSALSEIYEIDQLIELPMLVGHYHLVAMTLNTLGVPLDEDLEGFPE
jgi:4-carboxymuconolactone decarboxylase